MFPCVPLCQVRHSDRIQEYILPRNNNLKATPLFAWTGRSKAAISFALSANSFGKDIDLMENIVSIKNTCDDFEVEFEVQPIKLAPQIDERQKKIREGLATADDQLAELQNTLDELNAQIDNLTNHADGLDYMVAVGSGVLAGIIDIFFVDDFSLDTANEWGKEKTNNFVVKIAQSQGYEGNDLYGAVKFLEAKYPIAADKATDAFGGGKQHHLRDFSHHPTPIGLFFSLLTQFTHKIYGTSTAGILQIVELKDGDLALIGKDFPEKVVFGVINWFFHMASDIAGSSCSILQGKEGTGLPGPIVSLLKELSALPIFSKMNDNGYKEFSGWISKLFNGTFLGEHDENGKIISAKKFDFRTELGIAAQLGRQAIPVVINECIVRGFYFIRRLLQEIKEHDVRRIKDLGSINWHNTLPFKNRTIIRMLTISTGTMTAIDLADAAIESAVKSGGVGPVFVSNMIVKVNFVGVGRFALAVGSDVKMGVQRSKARNKRIVMMNEKIFLLNAKVFYKEANVWIAADNAGQTIEEAYESMVKASQEFSAAYQDVQKSMEGIGKTFPDIEKKNPQLLAGMEDILEWG